MAAPEHIKALLDFAAVRVSEMRDGNFFIEDSRLGPVNLSTSPHIQLTKTGGTTGHREQGGNYISYTLQIPSVKINYSIYVTRSSGDPAVNQRAVVRAIRWFIANYNGGSVFTRDEAAT